MDLAAWLTRRTMFGGFQILITYRALAICEQETGQNMLSVDIAQPSAALLRGLLYGAAIQAGQDTTPANIGRLISRDTSGAWRAVSEAWVASMPDPEPDKENATGPSATWFDIWSAARDRHHLTDSEFLSMTPRMFHALERRYLERMQREEFLVGVLASTFANFSMAAPKKPQSPEQYMIHKLPERAPDPITGESILAKLSQFEGV